MVQGVPEIRICGGRIQSTKDLFCTCRVGLIIREDGAKDQDN